MFNWIIENKKIMTLVVLLFFVSTISFALGYLMALETEREAIVIEKNTEL